MPEGIEWVDTIFVGSVVALAAGAGALMLKGFENPPERAQSISKGQCSTCRGSGKLRCYVCGGSGKDKTRQTRSANLNCKKCSSSGKIVCPICDGSGVSTTGRTRIRTAPTTIVKQG
eukprot:CAMPEP_0196654758 /NCGR_PEP_ID=MMETSP1086-20130531/4482_1 /TAXON_ID=77921 /ORGANISM="Cyanoptyche  gloeocystis , Strain SAG4.97" /LENGTH=116 /DNA_ID=CAMNT_0041986691 /DNA_START=148 /DNA_END=498 /DNA_ORIENTATION=-